MIFAHPAGNTPGIRHLRRGIEAFCRVAGIELLPEKAVGQSGDGETGRIQRFVAELPGNTGIITVPPKAGTVFAREMARQRRGALSGDRVIAVDDSGGEDVAQYGVTCLNFPWKRRIEAAVDYITAPDDIAVKRAFFMPDLVEA